MSRQPNFFIVGAPKCGTTAMAHYLERHPRICMAHHKEPCFFATDIPGSRLVGSRKEYEALFADATDEHAVVFESSVLYLFSTTAAAEIAAFNPEAKLLAMLRDPVPMLSSQHAQFLYTLIEDEEDFATAWKLQEARQHGEHLPPGCYHPGLLQYRELAAFGTQVERFLQHFPREQMLILTFDEFVADTEGCYRRVLQFLGLDYDHPADFLPVNERKTMRSKSLRRVQAFVREHFRRIASWPVIGPAALAANGLLHRLNSRRAATKPVVPDWLAAEIRRDLDPEIAKLESLTGIDLRRWRLS